MKKTNETTWIGLETPTNVLVRAAQNQNDAAFGALVNRWRKPVLRRLTLRFNGNTSEAEDAAQEAFVLAYRRLGDLQDPSRWGGWIMTIAERVARKRKAQRVLESQRYRANSAVLLETFADTSFGQTENSPPSFEAIHRELLKAALSALPPELAEAATLFYLARLGQSEIAQWANVPVGTVKSRLFRARKLLERILTNMKNEEIIAPAEDYGRAIIGGMRGVIHWRSLLVGADLEGWRGENKLPIPAWRRTGETLVGENKSGSGGLITGEASWTNYELSVLVTPISGGNAQIFFRLSPDNKQGYLLDLLLGWQAVAVSKVDLSNQAAPVQKLSVVNHPLERGREYDMLIAARDASLTTYVDGKLVNQVTDFSHASGPIAFSVFESKTAFRDPRIRLLQ